MASAQRFQTLLDAGTPNAEAARALANARQDVTLQLVDVRFRTSFDDSAKR